MIGIKKRFFSLLQARNRSSSSRSSAEASSSSVVATTKKLDILITIMVMMMYLVARTNGRRLIPPVVTKGRNLSSTSSLNYLPPAFLNTMNRRRTSSNLCNKESIIIHNPEVMMQQTRKQQRKQQLMNAYTPTKTTRLYSTTTTKDDDGTTNDDNNNDDDGSIFATQETTFESIGIKSPVLLERLKSIGLTRPTQIQAKAFSDIHNKAGGDVTIGAETGSGKTLAYLLPLLDDILNQKMKQQQGSDDSEASTEAGPALSYDYARAIILVPNKELVQQVLRMAIPLCGGNKCVIWGAGAQLPDDKDKVENDDDDNDDPCNTVRLAVMPGGLRDPLDFKPFRDTLALGGDDPPIDIVISTPAAIGPLGLSPKHITMFADIATLVVDEADMLLDGGYIRPLENVLMGFRRADKLDPTMGVQRTQHVFCAATLPDMGLKSVDAYLQKKFPYATRIQMAGMHNARHYGLAEATAWYQVESRKERMEKLVDLLETKGELQGEKVMVFLNSVDDVDGATGALQRAGVPCVPYHAKLSLGERTENLDRFRRYGTDKQKDIDTVPVLVCTDLASRGLDVPGVTAVVQLQFSGNVVSHLHRMGRCGRAGQRTGRGIVFYSEYEAELVKVVRDAEKQQERMVLQGDVDFQDDDDSDNKATGTVEKAFSRKRGFTKKRKKLKREARADY